ncbi:hypothetical protein B9T24_12235 [Acinetobacter sp. ANC 4654]|uniref:hypothetical protein n=1 Tax=Acinetobacter sp. ANC 4654 TaxID=1977872 RepID=UPI000A353417|nr:hypothetical protein [Acinetobacter sp. ANC 4654]OTG94519.1 hypothetical protein B9T24_12235 [Acinetobacter sp. ANC 4654]
MSNNKLASELVLTATENLADEFLFKTANTFLEDAIKSIPFASLITGSIETYSRFRTLKEQRQLLAFIQEAENINQGFIEKFFKDKNNTQLGFEILGVLDQTYLKQQAKMIGRVTLLFKDGKIPKQDFDKYTYIITKLNNHLITLISKLYAEYSINSPQSIISIPLPNMDLISFGFIHKLAEGSWFEEAQNATPYDYKIHDDYFYFYENIFKD